MAGKGDTNRPLSVTRQEWDENWTRAFALHDAKQPEPVREDRRDHDRHQPVSV